MMVTVAECTQEQLVIVVLLREAFDFYPKRPSARDLAEYDARLREKYVLGLFPTYNDALRVAELPVRRPGREDLILAIQRFYAKYGHVPTLMDVEGGQVTYSRTAFERQFKTWNRAVMAAGFKPYMENSPKKQPSRRHLITSLQRLTRKLSRIPSLSEVESSPITPSLYYYTKEFGTMTKAREIARLTELLPPVIPKEERRQMMLNYLVDLTVLCGRVPSFAFLARLPNRKFSPSDYKREFGSWNAAIAEANLPQNCTDLRWQDRSGYVKTDSNETIMLSEGIFVHVSIEEKPVAVVNNENVARSTPNENTDSSDEDVA